MAKETASLAHATDAGNIPLRGGCLCLDFVNTVDGRRAARGEVAPRSGVENRDYLQTYPDLVAWSRNVKMLGAREAEMLLKKGRRHPTEAARVLSRAVRLREAIYRVLSTVMARGTPAAPDLGVLNDELAEAMTHGRILPSNGGFAWDWPAGEPALDRVLWPVARSAADLLTSENLRRVRTCAGNDCGWLFLDASKNRSRRWCTMASCGNRAKARRHYARTRAARAEQLARRSRSRQVPGLLRWTSRQG